VAFGSGALGAYASASLRSEAQLLPIPEGVSDEAAAAIMLKGMTAAYLLTQTRVLTANDTILLHAAAGGTGLLMLQWAKDLGARVIGVVGSEEKAEIVARHGCDHILLRGRDPIAPTVRELTDGKGVPVVYDSVGRATFQDSLDSLAPRGLFVSFGNASGPAPDVTPAVLAAKGSLYLYPAHPGELCADPGGTRRPRRGRLRARGSRGPFRGNSSALPLGSRRRCAPSVGVGQNPGRDDSRALGLKQLILRSVQERCEGVAAPVVGVGAVHEAPMGVPDRRRVRSLAEAEQG
jgi:hypothetical protein